MVKYPHRSWQYQTYVCPECKNELLFEDNWLNCQTCDNAYPIINSIPSFILFDIAQSDDKLLKWADRYYNRLAKIYERSRYPWRLMLHAGIGAPSLKDLVQITIDWIEIEEGIILDVGCGPATFGRRIATDRKIVYGIDVSMRMLQQGKAYARAEKKPNVYFSHGIVQSLPYRDNFFDAAVCTAALHFFTDPLDALCKISQTLKPGGTLVVQTMSEDRKGIFRFQRVRRLAHKRGSHLFSIPQLEEYLQIARMGNYQFRQFGSMILFRAQKVRS